MSVSAALSEGFCPYGHPVTREMLHGEMQSCCRTCGASWLTGPFGHVVGGCGCVPGDHTCGERQRL